jgi:hypothetical protein
MLDRSQTANLFSETLPSVEGEPPSVSEAPQPAKKSRRTPRQRRQRRAPARRPPTLAVLRASVSGRVRAQRARVAARLPQLRKARVLAPAVVLLVLAVTDPAGCGRSVSPSPVRRPAGASTSPGVAVRTVTVHSVTPRPASTRVAANIVRATAHLLRARSATPISPATPAYTPPPSAPRPPAQPESQPPPSSPVPAPSAPAIGRPPPSSGQGDEFGFER